MRRILVTGGAGFVGRHMITALQQRDDVSQIYSVDLRDMQVNWDLRIPAHLHIIQDLRTYLRSDTGHFDLVIHCAYHVGGRQGIDHAKRNLALNLELDAALFDWAVQTGQPRILYFSSSAVYPRWIQTSAPDPGSGLVLPHLLNEELCIATGELGGAPDADYGWAKLTGERLAANARELGVAVHVCRPFSGFGADQALDYPFPAILARVRAGDMTVWGPPGQTRDWIHVDDVIAGALAVVDADHQEPINLCTGRGVEMGDLASMIADQLREQGVPYFPPVQYDVSQPTGVLWRVGDPTTMNKIYTARVSLEEGIRRALETRA